MSHLPTAYQESIAVSKYARWQDELGRREYWPETTNRYATFFRERFGDVLSPTQWNVLENAITDLEVMPSMRCLMTAGPALAKDEVAGYNPLSGDTLVLTQDEGLLPISEIAKRGGSVILNSDGKWQAATARSYGMQDTVLVTFNFNSRKIEVRATRQHEWLLTDGRRVKTQDLQRHDQVAAISAPADVDEADEDYRLGVMHGIIYGDGTATYSHHRKSKGFQIRICGDHDDIMPWFDGYPVCYPPSYSGDPVVMMNDDFAKTHDLKSLPDDEETHSYLIGFFRGWLAADGSTGVDGTTGIAGSLDELEWLRSIMPRFGYWFSIPREGSLETNYGPRKKQTWWMRVERETLSPDDILIARKRARHKPLSVVYSVREVGDEARQEEVFCATVPGSHAFVLDHGLVTGNCSYVAMDRVEAFDETMYLLMCGVGVGFSVEDRYVSKLPQVPQVIDRVDDVIDVADSKYGWAEALRRLLKSLYDGRHPTWTTERVRPAGAKLVTFGGRASGPAPLENLFRHVVKTFTAARGRRLSRREVHSIACKIGDIVVVGGVRRSAMISLSDADDYEMRRAKSGLWWESDPHFAMANNSAVWYERPSAERYMDEFTHLIRSKSGERGIFNRAAAQAQVGKTGRRDVNHEFGTNPCGEILLRDRQLCNLSEVVARPNDTFDDLRRKVKVAAIMGTLQSTLTNFRYVSPQWQRNCEDERLLGVSITGIMDHPTLQNHSNLRLPSLLEELRELAHTTNADLAEKLDIAPSAAVTCVKPSGNTSQLVNSASGIHPRYARAYIRRIRMSKNDPLAQLMMDWEVPHEDEVGHPDTTTVFSWPQIAPANSITRHDVSALDQLKLWQTYNTHWCEHKPSITVNVRDHEWPAVAAYAWEHFDTLSGVAFLPDEDHSYVQAPYEEVEVDQARRLKDEMPDVPWELLTTYEADDLTESARELACSAGACEL